MLKILIITSGTTHFHLVTIVIVSVFQAFGVPIMSSKIQPCHSHE